MSKQNFVLTSTAHGTMIVPRFDYKKVGDDYELGVGAHCLECGDHDLDGVTVMGAILEQRQALFGTGVVMIDAGANIGTVTLSLARHMEGWGEVLAFEPQDAIFMTLCGNVMINNLYHNVRTYRAALGRKDGMIDFPVPDYGIPGQYGGINALGEADIGQEIATTKPTPVKRIDALGLQRLDFLKLDVEGMELEVIIGGMETIGRCRPVIFAEWIKTGKEPLVSCLSKLGYQTADCGIDLVAAYGPNEIVDKLREMNREAAA